MPRGARGRRSILTRRCAGPPASPGPATTVEEVHGHKKGQFDWDDMPNMCDDPVAALAGLTTMIQESLLERTWQVWPVCPLHGFGVHGAERDGEVV